MQLFQRIHKILTIDDIDELDECDIEFLDYANKNLLFHNDKKHLLISSYSCVTLTNSMHFINHILLSMECFSTEFDTMLYQTMKDFFRHAKLIGQEDDAESLEWNLN